MNPEAVLESGVEKSTGVRAPLTNALSIDVEDYYQVSAFERAVRFEDWGKQESRVFGNTVRILEILHHHQVKATFFVLGWVAEFFPKVVREIADAGHEIASHSYNHRLVYELSPEAFREDIRRTKRILEDLIGDRVVGYRAPSYSIVRESLWALEVLMEEGFLYDSSIFPIYHDRYGLPSFPRHPYWIERNGRGLMEFPPSTIRFGGVNIPISGGGYFRFFPYSLIRWGLLRLNRIEGEPAVVYLHPWEVDYNQPRLNGGLVSNVRHYLNLGRTEAILRRLLREFSFGPVRALLEQRGDAIKMVNRVSL